MSETQPKNKTYKALGSNVIVRVNTQDLEKIGTLYIATSKNVVTDQARDEVEIVDLGEDAFSDLDEDNRPKVGDTVIIPRYEGVVLGRSVEDMVSEKKTDMQLRVVSDERVLAVVREE